MVDAVREPYSLQVGFKRLEVCCSAVSAVCGVDGLKQTADLQIVFEVLVKQNIAACGGCLRKMVNVKFLKGKKLHPIQLGVCVHLSMTIIHLR